MSDSKTVDDISWMRNPVTMTWLGIEPGTNLSITASMNSVTSRHGLMLHTQILLNPSIIIMHIVNLVCKWAIRISENSGRPFRYTATQSCVQMQGNR